MYLTLHMSFSYDVLLHALCVHLLHNLIVVYHLYINYDILCMFTCAIYVTGPHLVGWHRYTRLTGRLTPC